MDHVQLSDALQRYFSDLFTCCDEEKSGKVQAKRATDLIKSANLSDEEISQVT